MPHNAKPSLCAALLAMAFATATSAQEVLPFAPAPSGYQGGPDDGDSTYKKRLEPKRLPKGAPNVLIILMDDMGPATSVTLRRGHQYTDARPHI